MSTPPFCVLGGKYYVIDFKVGLPSGATIVESDTLAILDWTFTDDLYISIPSGYAGNASLGIGYIPDSLVVSDDYIIEMYLPAYQYGVKKMIVLVQTPYTNGVFAIDSWGGNFNAYAGGEVSYSVPIATHQGNNVTVKFEKIGNTMNLYINGGLVDTTASITDPQYEVGSAQVSTVFGQQNNSSATHIINNQPYGYSSIVNSGMPNQCLGSKPTYHRIAPNGTQKASHFKIIEGNLSTRELQSISKQMQVAT